jgi:hypothetical protein
VNPDDPRHGEERGYFTHRRLGEPACADCTNGHRIAQNRRTLRILEGKPSRVPALGSQRRIQALHRLGWTMQAIAQEASRGREQLKGIMEQQHVSRPVAQMVADVYGRLSMTLPAPKDQWERGRVTATRAKAERNGWAPPLAWDDIDDPNERPSGHRVCAREDCQSPIVARGLCINHYNRARERGDYERGARAVS